MDLERVNDIAARFAAKRQWSAPEYIDNGASAAVYKVDSGGTPIALKIYDPTYFSGDNALIEARRCELQIGLKGHGSKHLIDIIDVGEIEEDGTWFLTMEYCPWRSLERVIASVPDDKVHELIKQLVSAVMFLEGLGPGYVHRDIKPANIAVSPDFDKLKLLDLGVLRKIDPDEGNGTDNDDARRFIATAQYSPPEFLTREELPGSDGYSAINLYQVGAVLHDLIMKEALFKAEAATKNKYILHKAVLSKIPRISNPNVPARLIAICSACLNKDAATRIKSVALPDLLADIDPPDAVRRRLLAAHLPPLPTAPSLDVWRTSVRSWIGTAARLEAAALGATVIKEERVPGLLRWRIEFGNVPAAVFVQLVRTERSLLLQIVSDSDPPVPTSVLEIGATGPDLPPTEIPTKIAAQYLYALELGNAAQNIKMGEGL